MKKYSDQIGGYGGEYKHRTQNFFGNLLACVDGVGTKILTAQYAQRKYNRDISSLGIDCVAMVVNDMICKGADPLFFLDYYASSKLDEWSFYQVIDGIHMGCEEAGMQLLGGETAELNGIIEQGTFDICGFGVGEIINELPYNVSKGDVVIGLFSHGLHSNGFSLINTADLDQYDEQFINTLSIKKHKYVKSPLNYIGGKYGIGREIFASDTIIGIKGRFIFEAPGITILQRAHRALEEAVFTDKQNFFKPIIGKKWVELVYGGFYFDPLTRNLETFLEDIQKSVNAVSYTHLTLPTSDLV